MNKKRESEMKVLKGLIIEHYKRPKQYHTKLLIILFIIIIVLLMMILELEKRESVAELRRAIKRNIELSKKEVELLNKKVKLNVKLVNKIIEIRVLTASSATLSSARGAGSFPALLVKRGGYYENYKK